MIYHTEITYEKVLVHGIMDAAKAFVSESEDGSNLVEISNVGNGREAAKDGLLSFLSSSGKKELKCVGKKFVNVEVDLIPEK